jgi:hypothetical protein
LELDRPFLQLPYTFDASVLHNEVIALDGESWLPHPSGLEGNSAVPLVSINGTAKDGFDGAMAPTPWLLQSPYMLQVVASFKEVVARSRLMRLAPGAVVQEHVDFNYHWYSRVRIHVPIVTDPAVRFFCGPEEVHMAAGDSWLFDSWQRHRVINNSAQDRIHLVIDIAGSANFWREVRQIQRGKAALTAQAIAFDLDKQPQLVTEQFPCAPIMAPGEMSAIVTELMADCTANADNDREILEYYHDLLFDLVHDWRQQWSLYGFAPEGITGFQKLLARTRSALKQGPRVLVTSSNNVGINPIIMQRILGAALQPHRAEEFATGRS